MWILEKLCKHLLSADLLVLSLPRGEYSDDTRVLVHTSRVALQHHPSHWHRMVREKVSASSSATGAVSDRTHLERRRSSYESSEGVEIKRQSFLIAYKTSLSRYIAIEFSCERKGQIKANQTKFPLNECSGIEIRFLAE